MSIEFARAVKTAAAGVAAASFLFVQPSAADNNGITRFAVRNCTPAQVLFCTYNKDDNIFAIPYDANKIQSGEKKRSSCGSAERCKVFSLISNKDVSKVLTNPLVLGPVTAASTATGAAAGAVFLPASFLPVGIAAGAAIGGGTTIAVVKSINAVEAGKTCAQALKDAKKAFDAMPAGATKQAIRDAQKPKLSGSWPKYKNYSFVVQPNGVPTLVEGDKC